MISHVHRCIFIHVPKCGGTSIEAHLREHAAALGGTPEPGKGWAFRRERLAEALNQHRDYFAFAFVRHPFDRLLSTWLHGLRGVGPYFERPVRDLSLAEYVRIAAEGRVAEQSAFDRYHLLPQVAFLPSPSRRELFGVPLDDQVSCGSVGRFERLEADFREVCRRLGIPERPLPRLNAAPAEAGSPSLHWSERFDAATVEFVKKLYRDDLAAFGYDPPSGRGDASVG